MNTGDDVELDLTETNELVFNVRVEGASSRPRTRLVIKAADVSYCFEGEQTSGGNVSFVVPRGMMVEGTYPSSIEVIVGNKMLVPLRFNSIMREGLRPTFDLVETRNVDDNVNVNVRHARSNSLKDRWNNKRSR